MDLEQTATTTPGVTTTPGLDVPNGGDFSEYWDLGRRYARKFVACEADCDEIVQEVFCRLLARSHPTSPPAVLELEGAATRSDASRWIGVFIKSIRNLCIDRLRQRAVRATSALPLEGLGRTEPPHPLLLAEERQRLRKAIAALPESWRAALLLRVEEELSYEQIATRMQASKAQVRTWIFRARRQLVQDLSL